MLVNFSIQNRDLTMPCQYDLRDRTLSFEELRKCPHTGQTEMNFVVLEGPNNRDESHNVIWKLATPFMEQYDPEGRRRA